MDAFQKPPFQANAFQDAPSFSVPAFQKCAFQWGAFQVDPCIKNDAQSGVRRLAMYQLQEEELKKDAQRFKEQVQEVVAVEAPAVVKTPARKVKLEPLVKLVAPKAPEFKRRPIVSEPSPITVGLAAQLKIWSSQVEGWLQQMAPFIEQQRKAIAAKRQQDAAANDADYRLRILLLAA